MLDEALNYAICITKAEHTDWNEINTDWDYQARLYRAGN